MGASKSSEKRGARQDGEERLITFGNRSSKKVLLTLLVANSTIHYYIRTLFQRLLFGTAPFSGHEKRPVSTYVRRLAGEKVNFIPFQTAIPKERGERTT